MKQPVKKKTVKKAPVPAGILTVLGVIVLCGLAAAGYIYFGEKKENVSVMAGQYNSGNQILYDEVIGYLTNTLEQEEEQSKGVASTAVDNYETIVHSGITALNRQHTEAVLQNVKKAILEYIPDAGQMGTEELDLIAGNITEMILFNIITQLEELSADTRTSSEYATLYQSISEEKEYLSEREFKITITASVNDAYIDSAVLLDAISNLTKEERDFLAKKLAEIQGNTIRPEVQDWLNQINSINDLKGEDGAQGAKGETGAQGPKGETGAQGAKGEAGVQGPKGETGAQGAKGETGAQGPKGETGAQGVQGEKGEQGIQGEKGEQGIQGETGEQGIQGEKGEQGIQGEKGEQGTQGEKGEQGIQGETGEQGIQGIQGEQGVQGEKGEQGIQGEKGEQGIKGEKGEQGVKGTDGYTPVKGVDYFTTDDVNSITNQATTILQSTLGDQVTYTYDAATKTLYINPK